MQQLDNGSQIVENIFRPNVTAENATGGEIQPEVNQFGNGAFVLLCFLYIYIGNILLGLIFNLISFVLLTKSWTKLNGTLKIVCQMGFNDVLQCCVCLSEVKTLKQQSWTFPAELCPIVSGAEIFTNSLTSYLTVALNYHTIALSNIKPDTCNNSNECLVIKKSREEQQQQDEGADGKRAISVLTPCVLVWFTCVSLCMPQLTLSSTFTNTTNGTICTIVDPFYSSFLLNMLMVFRVYIPQMFLIIGTLILLRRLLYDEKDDSFRELIFTLTLNVIYFLVSSPRNVSYALQCYNKTKNNLNMPPLSGYFENPFFNLLVCMWYYSSVFLKPLLYFFLLPKFREVVSNGISEAI